MYQLVITDKQYLICYLLLSQINKCNSQMLYIWHKKLKAVKIKYRKIFVIATLLPIIQTKVENGSIIHNKEECAYAFLKVTTDNVFTRQ